MLTKICTKCKEEKGLEEFQHNKKSKDGFSYNCKSCLAIQFEKYRRAQGAKPKMIIQHTETGKICTKCGVDKPLYAFGRARKSKDGLEWHCKSCQSEKAKSFNANPLKTKQPSLITEKVCVSCKELKPATQFNMLNKVHGTLQRLCRQCESNYKHDYHIKNKEKICARSNLYYARNKEYVKSRIRDYRKIKPEHVRALERQWRDNNKDKKKTSDAKYRKENLEKIKQYRKVFRLLNWERLSQRAKYYANLRKEERKIYSHNWTKNNPEKLKQYYHNRRARKKGNGGIHTAKEWLELKRKYNFTCLKCGKKEPNIKLTKDHVFPLIWGGKNDIKNLQPLCLTCNLSKNKRYADYRPDSKNYGVGWKQPSLWGKVS